MVAVLNVAIGLVGYLYTTWILTAVFVWWSETEQYAPEAVRPLLFHRTVNGGVGAHAEMPGDVVEAVKTNVILLCLFAVQHTIMAREGFKKALCTVLPRALERTLFVVLAAGTMHHLALRWVPIPEVLYTVPEAVQPVFYALHVSGLLFLFASTFMLDHFELMGLKQSFGLSHAAETGVPVLSTAYAYAYIRHPIMAGFLTSFLFFPVYTTGRLLFAVVSGVYIILAVKFLEEPALCGILGKQYEQYMAEVPAYCPLFAGKKADAQKKSQ
eukprot:Rhum_TRINITY_DN14626_c0_g1::Rhum_TRINITY_DN14626_c0_g1_i1::g.103699::m.103699/K21310/mddA; methanethiol S-methyltransferase